MKYQPITISELSKCRNQQNFDAAKLVIDNLDRFEGFNIGDILIRKLINSQTKELRIDKSGNGLPERFVVIYKDSYGFLYTKRFLRKGTLSLSVDCITITTGRSRTYEIDTNYANSAILGTAFNPAEEVLRANEEVRERRVSKKRNRRIDEQTRCSQVN